MHSLLLKKALPFALTFVIGSFVGGLFKFFGVGGQTPAPARSYFYGYGEGRGRSCRARMRQRYLVAETKPLTILFKPDAMLSAAPGARAFIPESVPVTVTFGADGKVHEVAPSSGAVYCAGAVLGGQADLRRGVTEHVWAVVERAARQIQFEPEMNNGVPATVVREVEIRVTLN